MATTRPARNVERKINLAGMEVTVLIPGAFYQCIEVGGWQDAQTGIKIPGPKAVMRDNEGTRQEMVGVTDIPDPVQIPHFKEVYEISDTGKSKKLVKLDFTADDEVPLHEGLALALSVGTLRMVPDEIVEAKYPQAWAKRFDELVYRDPTIHERTSSLAFFKEAEDQNRLQHLANTITATELAAKPTPPKQTTVVDKLPTLVPPKPPLPPRP